MKEFQELTNIVERLRSEGGCSWDRAQKVGNLKTYLLEEVYELIDTINAKDIKRI